ncbi:MAG: GNAT family N-acetyltransferase [Pseudomonadota bacterium]
MRHSSSMILATRSSPPATLRTERLAGRPFRREDWLLVHALQSDPRTGAWLRGPHLPPCEDRSQTIAARFAEAWAADGLGPYVWRAGVRDVGYAGLRRSRLPGGGELEVLWAILPEHQGRGYATEAAQAAIDADGRGVGLVSWTTPENRASIRVMEKLGLRYDCDLVWADQPHVVYRRPAGGEPGDDGARLFDG